MAARNSGERDFLLVDVREKVERDINQIPGSVLIPKGDFQTGEALATLPQDKQVVLYCKTESAQLRCWRWCTVPASRMPSTSAAVSAPGSTRSTSPSRPTERQGPRTPGVRGLLSSWLNSDRVDLVRLRTLRALGGLELTRWPSSSVRNPVVSIAL